MTASADTDALKSKASLDALPCELTSKIMDNLALAAAEDESSAVLDKFHLSLAPGPAPYAGYSQDLLSLMVVNKLFYELVTARFLTTITVASHKPRSLACLKTDKHPFVFNCDDHADSHSVSSSSLSVSKSSASKLPSYQLPTVQKLWLNCHDRESATSLKYSLLLDWSRVSISKSLACLTVDTSVFNFLQKKYKNSEELKNSMNSLATGFAKLVALQEHKITSTLINSEPDLRNISILIKSFDQQRVLSSVEGLHMNHYLGNPSDDMSIIQTLLNLKTLTFESLHNIEKTFLPILEGFSHLEQLTFKSIETPLPPAFPKTLKKLSTYNYSFFHKALASRPYNLDNLVELRINFLGVFPCNTAISMRSLKTLVLEGQTEKNLDAISFFLSQNPGITALSIPISTKLICGYFESRRFFPSLRNIECLNLCFESFRLNDADVSCSKSVLETIFTHMRRLKVLLLQSTSSHISLEYLIKALTSTYVNRTTDLTLISAYFTPNARANCTASPLSCFQEVASNIDIQDRLSFFPNGVVLADFIKVKQLAPTRTFANGLCPTAKVDIDVVMLKKLFKNNPSITSAAKSSECLTRRIAQIHQIPWFL
jgi:hypothetical protein